MASQTSLLGEFPSSLKLPPTFWSGLPLPSLSALWVRGPHVTQEALTRGNQRPARQSGDNGPWQSHPRGKSLVDHGLHMGNMVHTQRHGGGCVHKGTPEMRAGLMRSGTPWGCPEHVWRRDTLGCSGLAWPWEVQLPPMPRERLKLPLESRQKS